MFKHTHTDTAARMEKGNYTKSEIFIQQNTLQKHTMCCFGWDRPENSQGHILFPGAVLAHAYAKARTEKQLSRGHQVALLRGFKLQHRRVPDESMQLAVGAGGREEGGKDGGLRCNSTVRNNTIVAIPPPTPVVLPEI